MTHVAAHLHVSMRAVKEVCAACELLQTAAVVSAAAAVAAAVLPAIAVAAAQAMQEMQQQRSSGGEWRVEHGAREAAQQRPAAPCCKSNGKPAAPFSCRLMTGISMRKPYCDARRTPRAGGRQGTKHQRSRSTKHEHKNKKKRRSRSTKAKAQVAKGRAAAAACSTETSSYLRP
jgi:hypothetical protein